MIMKKKKKEKVRWLAVLLAGCLLLSIVPATAFAAEDTAPAKSENSAGEEEVATLSLEQPKPDYLPQGVTYFSDGYKHAYHTRVDVTANVSVKDSTGTVVETTQVSKSSGEFNFIT